VSSVGKAGKDALLYLPGRLVVGCIGFVVLPLLTHVFPDAAEIGRYDLTLRFTQFLHILLTAWLGTSMVRYYADYTGRGQSTVFYTVILCLRRVGIILGVVFLGGIYVWGPDALVHSYRDLLPVGALVFVGFAMFETDQMLLRAKGRAGAFSVSLIVTTLGKFVLGFLIVFVFKTGIEGILWGSALFPLLIHAAWLRKEFGASRLLPQKDDRPFIKELLFFGLPIAISGTLRFALSNADRFFLRWLTGTDDAVGMFAVGNLFGDQPISLLSATLMLAAFPEISRIYDQESRANAERFLAQITRIYLLITMLLVALTIAGAPFVFKFIIAGKAQNSWDVVPYIAGATFVLGISNYAGLGVYMGKRSDKLLWCTAIGLAANMGLNVVFIPFMGYVGCGVARFIANAIFLTAVTVASSRYLHWHFPFLTLVRSFLAALCAGSFLFAVGHFTLIGLPVVPGMALLAVLASLAVATYGTVLFVTREVSKENLSNWFRLLIKPSK